MFYGLRFDAFSIAASNSLYILLVLLPFSFAHNEKYLRFLKIIFIISNAIFILPNLIDVVYFSFTQKRSTYSFFNLIFSNEIDLLKLLPHFLRSFWYLFVIYIALIWILMRSYKNSQLNLKPISGSFKNLTAYTTISFSIIALNVLALRGGFQKVPIVLLDAAQNTKAQYIPIVLNTPFSMLKSADLTELKHLQILPDNSVNNIFNPYHKADTGRFNKMNVCVIILEGFSKEFTGMSDLKSYTPFLDSLMSKSFVFTNAYANGKSSIEGIPSILASLPSFMQNPYLNSAYSSNTIESLASILKQKGYNSTFFHGGTNGTMNFNAFAKIAGYDNYYGRTEYNNDKDYDGKWGIWDDAFLQKIPGVINSFKEPFFTSVFTLSSHDPFLVPDKFKNKFPKGRQDIIESIGYTDYSLRLFFNECKKQAWFSNTLFVITADHTASSVNRFYSNLVGQYSIPMFVFKNNELIGKSGKTVQQIDILPTVLDILNFDKPFYAFGKSMFSDDSAPAIYFSNPNFFIVDDSMVYISSNYKFTEAYNFKNDSSLTKSILGRNKKSERELTIYSNAFIQKYVNDIIENKTHLNYTNSN
jgi:phosphoglycerol transferase MdoB-like AlkP superfamily enzyme